MVEKHSVFFLLLCLTYILYVLLGAVVFSTLEQPYEDRLRSQLEALWSEFMASNPCVSEVALEEFLHKALLAKSFGVSFHRNVTEYTTKWDFVASIFFTGTTLTTIGYGHPFPISLGGKIFCLVYSIFGIPFTLSVLSITARNLLIFLRDKPIHHIQLRFNISRKKLEWLHAAILMCFLSIIFFFVPAIVFNVVEGNWDYVDALYFCFISLTTVGLGDYVPGEQSGQKMPDLYKLSVTCYLLLGLVAVLIIIEMLKSLLNFNQVFNIFLLGGEESRRTEGIEWVLPHDSEGPCMQPKPDETTRRRLTHSLSPDKTYGSINTS
ncbi:potassium channel subfamily K member 1-like [Bombina bombina]|uniref:potassium channel subfamily K member 1-like n=1 Tax=Bombina bombina TaxID=8345 RepID=UPI00235AD3F6|nr:potassium channel subfamily K member 1-like [Bombina bombina]